MRFHALKVMGLAAMLSGCGVIYQTSTVREAAGGGDGVRIVDVSPAIVQRANMDAYEPRSLPQAFSTIAGGTAPRVNAALPDPIFDAETRPGAIEMRLPPEVDPGPYRIGVGDVLVLATPRTGATVEELAGLVAAQSQRQGYTVQDDGAIAVPDVGRINVGGLTLEVAEDAVFDRLIEVNMDPSFSLEVAEFNSQRVTIGGAINQPGIVPITISPLFLDEVIAGSGGLAVPTDEFAVIRIYRAGALYQIPVSELLSESGLRRIRLLDGDSVFVDTAFNLDRAQSFFEEQIARAEFTREARADAIAELSTEISIRRAALEESRENFRSRLEFGAQEREYAYVAGEVDTLGRFALPFEARATVADALFDAGGIVALTGDPSQIYVLRADDSMVNAGGITAYRLDARNAANYALAAQMELRPADVVFVSSQPVTQWNRVLSQLVPSLAVANTADRFTN